MNNPHSARRSHGNKTASKSNSLSSMKAAENDQDSDQVPFGVVNSMKQRFLSKVNESYVFNQNSTPTARPSLSKTSSRLSSNENLLQTKILTSPLKRSTRLSRSQDNLFNPSSLPPISGQTIIAEQYTSYLQPKHELIIVDTSNKQIINYETENDRCTDDDQQDDGKLRTGQKPSSNRHSYTELHRDEVPKPGTVTTVKNMFERQIRLSRYDADKIFVTNTPGSSRMSSQHRDVPSPIRSRSMSPNDMALRQRRSIVPGQTIPSTSSTALSVPIGTSYPDLVISHTPPTEPSKISNESILINTHSDGLPMNNPMVTKEKKLFVPVRNPPTHETQIPLSVIVDDHPTKTSNQQRPNLLLPSKSSESVDCEPLDFKSRLALFNRNNIQPAQETTTTNKKPPVTQTTTTNPSVNPNLSKPIVQQPVRPIVEEKFDIQSEMISSPLVPMSIARSVINPAKAVTFFGGNKLNGNNKSSLPTTIPTPPAPIPSKSEKPSMSNGIDPFRSPDIVGGNVKLNKSSMFSGARKEARVQFIEDVDTFEYPSFEVAMAEHGGADSDDEHRPGDDDDDDEPSSAGSANGDDNIQLKSIKHDQFLPFNATQDDVDDDELERLARINAKFNSNQPTEKTLKPKGTLHTFRPTHLDQYELGSQHGSTKTSDNSSSVNSYSQMAREKLLTSTENGSIKHLPQHSLVKQQKANFDLATNIQWSSMSTTTDLLF